MRKLTYLVASTLDGFIAGSDGADPSGQEGFWPMPDDYVQHIIDHYPETLPVQARQALGVTAAGECFDTVLEGRRSFQVGLDAGVADAYPHLRHIVFSRTLDERRDSAVELVASDPVGNVQSLKREDGKDIWLVGGGALAGALSDEIDRLIVKLSPLTLGTGVPLFGHDASFSPQSWLLVDHTVLGSGAAILTFDRAPGRLAGETNHQP